MGGLWVDPVTIEERRRRFYDGRTIRWIVATSFISGGVV